MATTKIFALALVLAITIFQVSAASFKFSLDSPEEVNQKEEFQISISIQNNSDLIYDVKAFVGSASKEISEIFYDGKWQSPFNYIKEAFPSESDFTLRANTAGDTKVCVRLRENGKTSFIESCNPINVIESAENSQNTAPDPKKSVPILKNSKTNPDSAQAKPVANSDSTVKSSVLNSPQILQSSSVSLSKPTVKIQKQEKIFLNQNSEMQKPISTQKQYFISALSYSFIFFLVILIILLALNKL